jgi:hypothetical protein
MVPKPEVEEAMCVAVRSVSVGSNVLYDAFKGAPNSRRVVVERSRDVAASRVK